MFKNDSFEHMNERARQLLKTIVEHYIRFGQPVASKMLAEQSGFSLSPATIRNIMADLEEQGFLSSLHTSSGRIPTSKGYRFFIDSILLTQPFSQENSSYSLGMNWQDDASSIIGSASNLLSSLTQLAGLVTLPNCDLMNVTYIEFLPLSGKRVLAVLVLNGKEVQNRVFQTDKVFSRSELQEISNYLMQHFENKPLHQVRSEILMAMHSERASIEGLIHDSLALADKVLADTPVTTDYILAGEQHLLENSDMTCIEKVRDLFLAFTEKQHILHLLDRCILAEGVQIFIGEESGHDALNSSSLVTAPYSIDGKVVGVLGVVGPTRMPYERVISMIDVTSRLLSAALSQDSISEIK